MGVGRRFTLNGFSCRVLVRAFCGEFFSYISISDTARRPLPRYELQDLALHAALLRCSSQCLDPRRRRRPRLGIHSIRIVTLLPSLPHSAHTPLIGDQSQGKPPSSTVAQDAQDKAPEPAEA
jgi:hypothetical protein